MQEPTLQRENEKELTFQVPLSEIYRFNEPEKKKDLLGTQREGTQKDTTMSPLKRFIISILGIFCLMVGLTGLLGRNPNIFSFLWVVLGLAIIWVFLAKPRMDKKKSRGNQRAGSDPTVTLTFSDSNIKIHSNQHEIKRDWQELIEYKKTKKGVHLYFIDGTASWLPADVFYEKDEMRDLMELLQKKTGVSGSAK